jgi:mannose-6-phosphate isomerase-like protein (cupin superfamily)
MQVRRVVTGHKGDRSTFVADGPADVMPLGPGGEAFAIWARDDTASFPDDGTAPETAGAPFPPIGGCRVMVLRLAAGESQAFDQFVTEGLAEFADPSQPGMHRTASLDFDIVLSGSVVLQLDDGEVELHAGDIVVQNGTRHRWENRGTEDAVMAVAIVGAGQALR